MLPDLAVTFGHVAEHRLDARWHDSGSAWVGKPLWMRELALCIARHESMNAGHYRADNPRSSASGRYQMLQAMWDGNVRWVPGGAAWVGLPASAAPPRIQDLAFINSIVHDGARHWRGTGCKGTE